MSLPGPNDQERAEKYIDATYVQRTGGHLVSSVRRWVLERGILYALLEAPILATISGIFYRVVPYRYALITILFAFMALPFWVSYRKQVSINREEPVHHLHKYTLYSLIPGAMFTVARIPTHFLWGLIYWHPWYDFGSELTGAPIGQYGSLFPGALLNALQGWSIAMGFYVLFRRHSLINAVLYIGIYDSSLYSYVFPTYSRAGLQSPPLWHAVDVWAHMAMAFTAWFMPILHIDAWPRLTNIPRAAAVALMATIVLTPTGFAFWRATTWQFPIDESIDQATFNRPGLMAMKDGPSLQAVGTDARYQFTLRFGPRGFTNYFRQARDLDAAPVRVTGTLSHDGRIIAWCSTYVERLESANLVTAPQQFWPVFRRTQFTDIPVQCMGPAAATTDLGGDSEVIVQWSAQMTLIGDRERQTREFFGRDPTQLSLGHP